MKRLRVVIASACVLALAGCTSTPGSTAPVFTPTPTPSPIDEANATVTALLKQAGNAPMSAIIFDFTTDDDSPRRLRSVRGEIVKDAKEQWLTLEPPQTSADPYFPNHDLQYMTSASLTPDQRQVDGIMAALPKLEKELRCQPKDHLEVTRSALPGGHALTTVRCSARDFSYRRALHDLDGGRIPVLAPPQTPEARLRPVLATMTKITGSSKVSDITVGQISEVETTRVTSAVPTSTNALGKPCYLELHMDSDDEHAVICSGPAPALTLDFTTSGISALLKRDGAKDPADRDYWIYGETKDGREIWEIQRATTRTTYSPDGVRLSRKPRR